jgi:steroid 5-alpha reductase family enzyme
MYELHSRSHCGHRHLQTTGIFVCANTAFTALQGIGIFTVSAWATQVAAMEGHGLSAGAYTRPFFLTIAVTMWSLRLGGFLFYRIVELGSDKCAIASD